jgi:hypothetical protein
MASIKTHRVTTAPESIFKADIVAAGGRFLSVPYPAAHELSGIDLSDHQLAVS